MVEQKEILTRGGIYLAGLDPAKINEIGTTRPIIILNSQTILDSIPPIIFICPLSSQSQPEFSNLHFELDVRDNLEVKSYALIEHCRSVSITRIIYPRLAQATSYEVNRILLILQQLVDV
ncbi:type II toxin-antitoxin system PemK/MazF family toxin [Rickettsia helvetica]|uniref:type II toxin-antitoxin system PemK/MazF family toxin n=1 Tax=Rickettsia helvetica TaxID=35789 RepID=UPI000288DD11|nr:type II toxin-antitoxin system PemK/MazF family toxin [Rickettsia helvetica]MCZ6884232.1 type II toxin-antitoxin system PemK/MazF family toxin [Rickettsia endosymbiont of Ixodes ricinus]MCZ6896525.1 type II toxin-antitoxin system PemK/MazF family toxin [Rickettsia endosymbiont of Ixodes ricinus]